jgi:WhiB family transcriptional regulator, redox-sensing transcriptional regulator
MLTAYPTSDLFAVERPSRRKQPALDLPCRHDPELWFAESPADLEQAKQLCAQCPVRATCLSTALAHREPWGVWGGEIFVNGKIVARKRPRGRPRKNEAAEVAA